MFVYIWLYPILALCRGEFEGTLEYDIMLTASHTANPPHRQRNPRLVRPRREDERPVRKLAAEDKRHNEPHAADGGKDGHRLAGVVGLLCVYRPAVLVCVVILGSVRRTSRNACVV